MNQRSPMRSPRTRPTARWCWCRTTTSRSSGRCCAQRRPDLRTVHFTPHPVRRRPTSCSVLPDAVAAELLEGMAGVRRLRVPHPTLGRRLRRLLPRGPRLRRRAPSSRRWPPTPTTSAPWPTDAECDAALADLDAQVGDRALIVRVDRIELSKNLLRGFHAFDDAARAPSRVAGAGRVRRVLLPVARRAARVPRLPPEVEALVARVNERWAHAGLDADPVRHDRRLPAAGRRAAPLRRAAREPGPRRPEPGGQGRRAGQRARRRRAAQPRGRRVGRAREARCGGSIRSTSAATADALATRWTRPPTSATAREAAAARDASRCAGTPADWLADQLARSDASRQLKPGLEQRDPPGPSTTRSARSSSSGGASSLRTPTRTVVHAAARPSRSSASKAGRSPTSSPTKQTAVESSASSRRPCPCRCRSAGAARRTCGRGARRARPGGLLLRLGPHRRLELGLAAVVQGQRQALGLDPHAGGATRADWSATSSMTSRHTPPVGWSKRRPCSTASRP